MRALYENELRRMLALLRLTDGQAQPFAAAAGHRQRTPARRATGQALAAAAIFARLVGRRGRWCRVGGVVLDR